MKRNLLITSSMKRLLLISTAANRSIKYPPCRWLSSSSSSSDTGNRSRDSSSSLKTWERGARKVKDTENYNNQYMESIRKIHDPSQHVKTIEDELKATIGEALGKQGRKILLAVQRMERELEEYCQAIEDHSSNNVSDQHSDGAVEDDCPEVVLQEIARRYNRHRKEALEARWELEIHRQAAGFLIGNQQYVKKQYPIPEALPSTTDIQGEGRGAVVKRVNENGKITIRVQNSNGTNKNVNDQLIDRWHQRVRWK